MPLTPKQQPPYYQNVDTTKVYQALLTQTGTNPPTIESLFINTLREPAPIFSHDSTGVFIVTHPSFIYEKTFVEITYGPIATHWATAGSEGSDGYIVINIFNHDGTKSNLTGEFFYLYITIKP